jgi:NCAIR mutase (PurE)-related protein
MDRNRLQELLEALSSGRMSTETAVEEIARYPGGDLGFAVPDGHRALRTGHAETIYGEGKSPEQIVAILRHLSDLGQDGLVTRAHQEKADAVASLWGDSSPELRHLPGSRLLHLKGPNSLMGLDQGCIGVICAGTSDLPVANEAADVAEIFGNKVVRFTDVGVAGLHRLLSRLDQIRQARVLIVVAGMEGALPSVVAGLVDRPVIAVPTSVGYGASFGGVAALLGMLNSCSPGISVVNIDNGYGAAVQSSLINRLDSSGSD